MHWLTQIEGGPRRVNHAAVAVGHKIYSFGGYCTGENSRDYTSMDVHVLNTSTFRWTKHPVSDLPYFENDDILPYKRYGHTAVVYKDKIYIWGGRNDRVSCSVLFCFDTAYHCWTAPRTYGCMPLARDGHTACVWRNYMFIFGGFEEDRDAFSYSLYRLDLETMTWSCIQTEGPEPSVRDFHTAVCNGDRMFVFGGRGPAMTANDEYSAIEEYPNQLWYLDLVTYEWHSPVVSGNLPFGRRSHSAFLYHNKMYIFGGFNAILRQHFNDLYEFDTTLFVWRKVLPLGEQPVERRRQSCILVDDRVFLFGGTSPRRSYYEQSSEIDDDKLLIDYNDMHVLDLNPTLKTLCILTVRKYKLNEAILPTALRIHIHNMFSPNKITVDRPNNSAG